MIRLKHKINKSLILFELREKAEKMYEHDWQPVLQIEAFMKGAKTFLKLIQIKNIKKD